MYFIRFKAAGETYQEQVRRILGPLVLLMEMGQPFPILCSDVYSNLGVLLCYDSVYNSILPFDAIHILYIEMSYVARWSHHYVNDGSTSST